VKQLPQRLHTASSACAARGTQSGRLGACSQVCNNLALAIQMASVAEAAALGKRLGLDAAVLADIFNSASARCWSSDSYHPVPVTRLPSVPVLLLSHAPDCSAVMLLHALETDTALHFTLGRA
jgi:3-hydroxyisobutyrate dehydrogenase-like beta-hydroxyacid dehydrogenase